VQLVSVDVEAHRGRVVEDDVEVGPDDLQADLAERVETLRGEEGPLAPGREDETEDERARPPESPGKPHVESGCLHVVLTVSGLLD
jgi:hypothetical protein